MPIKRIPTSIDVLYVNGRSMLFMLGELPLEKSAEAIRKKVEREGTKRGFTFYQDPDSQGALFDYYEVLAAQKKIVPIAPKKRAA